MLLMFTFGWLDYPFSLFLFSSFFISSHITFIIITVLPLFLKEETCLDFKLRSVSLLQFPRLPLKAVRKRQAVLP